jgi:hypothetical protein
VKQQLNWEEQKAICAAKNSNVRFTLPKERFEEVTPVLVRLTNLGIGDVGEYGNDGQSEYSPRKEKNKRMSRQ